MTCPWGEPAYRPITYDTPDVVSAFAEQVLEAHETIAGRMACFSASWDDDARDAAAGRVESVVSSCFGTIFGATPADRFADVFAQVSCFAIHLAKDHIFADGNKRTALLVSMALLRKAGIRVRLDDDADPAKNEAYLWIQDAVSGARGEDDLAELLRSSVVADGRRSR